MRGIHPVHVERDRRWGRAARPAKVLRDLDAVVAEGEAADGGGDVPEPPDRRDLRLVDGLVVRGDQPFERPATRVLALSVLADLRPARADLEGLRPLGQGPTSPGWLGCFACDGYVGADPVQRFQYVGLCFFHARRRSGDGDDEADPQREAQRDESSLPHSAAQLPPQIGEEKHGLRSRWLAEPVAAMATGRWTQVYAAAGCTGVTPGASGCASWPRAGVTAVQPQAQQPGKRTPSTRVREAGTQPMSQRSSGQSGQSGQAGRGQAGRDWPDDLWPDDDGQAGPGGSAGDSAGEGSSPGEAGPPPMPPRETEVPPGGTGAAPGGTGAAPGGTGAPPGGAGAPPMPPGWPGAAPPNRRIRPGVLALIIVATAAAGAGVTAV